jgi:Fe-S-cluster-containing hydrogenase component 2
MAKTLMIHPDKCTGCRNCELACSFKQEGAFRPGATNVHVFTWEREGFSVPLMCQQCDDAACVRVCPTGAMYHSSDTPNLVAFDQALCIGCKMCVVACPFGNVSYDTSSKRVAKCDTCGGSPECVAFCPNGALEFAEDDAQVRTRKKAFASKFRDVFGEGR